MAMDAPRVAFQKTGESGEIWRAKALLPICLTAKMRWRLTLFLNEKTAIPWEMEILR